MEKQITIVMADGSRVVDAVIKSGTTPRTVLQQLNLPDNLVLARNEGTPFNMDEDLFSQVNTGEKLYAVPPANVGGTS